MRNLLARLVMWIVQPRLAPMLRELSQVQDQIMARLKDLEEKV